MVESGAPPLRFVIAAMRAVAARLGKTQPRIC